MSEMSIAKMRQRLRVLEAGLTLRPAHARLYELLLQVGSTDLTNGQLGTLLGLDLFTISRGVSRLAAAGLVTVRKAGRVRTITAL